MVRLPRGATEGAVVYLGKDASKARLREAANARANRGEIIKALSQGQVTRRDLIRIDRKSVV